MVSSSSSSDELSSARVEACSNEKGACVTRQEPCLSKMVKTSCFVMSIQISLKFI